MKRYLINKEGSSLIYVLLLLIIFSVLGTALLGSTLSGVRQVNYRQHHNQAIQSSEMGVDYALAYIDQQLDLYRDDKGEIDFSLLGYHPDDLIDGLSIATVFRDLLETILAPFSAGSGYASPDQDFVVTFDPSSLNLTATGNVVEGDLKLVSVGTSGGVTKQVDYTISISASGVFEVLSYAVGAEGNIYLHGGSTITGDIYAGKDLYMYDHAHVFSGSDYYIPSVYGCLQSDNSRVLGNVIRVNSISNYSRHISENGGANYTTLSPSNLSSVFNCDAPRISNNPTEFPTINPADFRSNYVIDRPNDQPSNTNRFSSSWYFHPTSGAFENRLVRPYKIFSGNLPTYLNFNKSFGGLHVNANSQIRTGADLTFGWVDDSGNFRGGLYVDGNLTIGNSSENEYNVNNYEKIKIKGPIFVNGNLNIIGADVQFDSTVYVNGNTEIRNSRLRGIQATDSSESSLVLFGNGEVKISNISAFENSPSSVSKVRGFFYSNQTLQIYGAGSNIQIEGGIFAKNIVLNAIRGNSYEREESGYYQPGSVNWWFEPDVKQAGMSPDESRLIIRHNSNLIENPPDALPLAGNITLNETDRTINE